MIIFGSPRRYVQGPGVIHDIGRQVARLDREGVLIVDKLVDTVIGDIVRARCAEAGVHLITLSFNGEVTLSSIQELEDLCKSKGGRTGVVIAAGGGKTIDAGKILAERLGARVVTVPTVASTDAPTSHIAVMYDQRHRLISVEKTKGNPEAVLVDTAIIAKAPRKLLVAGIGDAIVKRFEVEQCVRANGVNVFGGRPPLSAIALARACYETIRQHSVGALSALDYGEPNDDLECVVEAAILMSGLAFESGGLSICHAMTRGLSALPGVAESLHGLQVSYGLLVQLTLERREETLIRDIEEFYRAVQLPRSLIELGYDGNPGPDLENVARLTIAAPHAKHFERTVHVEEFVQAMITVELRYKAGRTSL